MSYFSFCGRAKRMQWWLVAVVGSIVIGIVSGASTTMMADGDDGGGGAIGLIPAVVLSIAFVWAAIATSVRRLHDQDKSGWWYLLSLVPIANIYIFILCGFIGGTAGENRFGAPPA